MRDRQHVDEYAKRIFGMMQEKIEGCEVRDCKMFNAQIQGSIRGYGKSKVYL